jgi:sensor c-di-GMP phosphodiesterase-like protein
LRRFGYLKVLLLSCALGAFLLSALLGGLLAWRSTQQTIDNSARRAVLNAERLIDKTSAELQKLDALNQLPCDAAVVAKLKDAVYTSTTLIREIGLIQNGTLYCTNFGPVDISLANVSNALEVGTFISAGPNAVIANNTSVYVYATRQPGRSVNAVINPSVMAELEQTTAFKEMAHIDLKYLARGVKPGSTEREHFIYELGDITIKSEGSPFLLGKFSSTRFPLASTVSIDRTVYWKEFIQTAGYLFSLLLPLSVVTALLADRFFSNGAISRMRYKNALRRGQLKVYYQPIMSSTERRLVGVEALLRWEHPQRGLLRAAQFSDLFSDHALDEIIARFVLETVHKDFTSALMVANPIWCSVNIAPALLEIPTFFALVARNTADLSPQQLRLEITERTPISAAAESTVREIRGIGVKVGLDDFGTGYSNMNQLQTVPYDFIKIDGLLIRGIQSTNGLSPVLDSVIQLAQRLGTELIAEGVETIVQADALSQQKVKLLQGYLFGHARPYSDIVEILKAQHMSDELALS